MRFQHQVVILILLFAVFGDVGNFLNSVWTGQEMIPQNSARLMPGAEAVLGHVVKAVGGVIKSMAKKGKKTGGSEHTKNKRPSNKQKHQKGQSRMKKDQQRASGKKQKGAKDGNKKRGGKK